MTSKKTTRFGWVAVLLGGLSLALLAVSVWGFRVNDWLWPQAYRVATWGVWAALIGMVFVALGLAVWLLRGTRGGTALFFGFLLSLPVAGLGVAFDLSARMTPPINDISTDTEDPPVFWYTQTPTDYPTRNTDLQRRAYPDILPLDLDLTLDEAFAAALALVEERDWQVLSADIDEAQIEAIAKSRLFGFEDEVAIRVTETDAGSRIDMRSRSRIGKIDRGANAHRIEAFLSDLAERVTDPSQTQE